MRVLLIVLAVVICTSCTTKGTETDYNGLRVNGRFLVDRFGEKVIMRGVNTMFVYSKDRYGDKTYPEIAKTGANATRIFWMTKISANEADANIDNCIKNEMIPILAVWDATGKWDEDLQKCVDYWCDSTTLELIKKYEDYLIVNIANEAGKEAMDDYLPLYKKAVSQMREAGIRVPIMIDADAWGRNEFALLDYGQELLASDPLNNLIFSWHPWNVDYEIEPVLRKSIELDIPFVVGEFAKYSVGCPCCIKYEDILEYGEKYEIGWLAWSWGLVNNGDCDKMNMTDHTNPVFETLHGWGLEVATESPYSIKATSKRSKIFTNDK